MLTALITGIVAGLTLFICVYGVYRYEKSRILANITHYFNSPDSKTPSAFAQTVDAVAFVFSQRLVSEAKTVVMGMNSVDSKNAVKAAKAEIISGNPKLGSILSVVPGLGRILKSPAGLALAAQILSSFGGNNKHAPSEQPPPGQSVFPL